MLVDVTGKNSQVRDNRNDALEIQQVSAAPVEWEIRWSGDLPANYQAISEVRVEIPQARYTWTLTVRKRGTSAGSVTEIDCVAFFNRPLGDPEEELLHRAFIASQQTTPEFQVAIPYSEGGPSDQYTITFAEAATEEPPVKKGGWLFDPQHALWYQMIDVIDESTPGSVTVQLDRLARDPISWVTIPQGVIKVFRLNPPRR